jgi:hypothetical protein
MLRAYVVLSRTLNLTKTCKELNATRQTVRRHINELEAIKGGKLFEVDERQYRLTELGKESLSDAAGILRNLDSWSGHSRFSRQSSKYLETSRYCDTDGREFLSQQHPVSKIATEGLPIMRCALSSWGEGHTQIEHEAMQKIRPYIVLYRKGPNGWVFVEVGQESAYSRWFGWAWSKSAIGKLMQEDNAGDDMNEFISGAYSRIYGEGGVRLDHLFAHLPREDSNDLIPVTFQRLLMGCVFPDGTPGLGVLVLITNQVDIDALQDHDIPGAPEELLMEFEI